MKIVAALLATTLLLAGCGDDGGGGADGGGGESASPQEVLRQAQAAIREVESYHVEGIQTDKEGRTALEGDVSGEGVRLGMEQKGASLEMIILGDNGYIRGDRAFWAQSGAPQQLQEQLAGKWAKAPVDDDLRGLAEQLMPDTIAACLADRLGTITSREATLDGQDVVVLVDKGDKPGSAPSELTVAADEPRRPLRVKQTGARKAGGPEPLKQCGDSDDSPEERSDIRLSKFDEVPAIEAPADAVDLEKLGGGGSS